MEDKQRSSMTAGLLLIALGAVFLFGQFDWHYADVFRMHKLWPLFLIVFGIGKLMQTPDARRPGARGAGGWMVFVGVLFHRRGKTPLT